MNMKDRFVFDLALIGFDIVFYNICGRFYCYHRLK